MIQSKLLITNSTEKPPLREHWHSTTPVRGKSPSARGKSPSARHCRASCAAAECRGSCQPSSQICSVSYATSKARRIADSRQKLDRRMAPSCRGCKPRSHVPPPKKNCNHESLFCSPTKGRSYRQSIPLTEAIRRDRSKSASFYWQWCPTTGSLVSNEQLEIWN